MPPPLGPPEGVRFKFIRDIFISWVSLGLKEILAVYFQFILPSATQISLHNLLCQSRWGQNSFILAQNWNVFFIFWIPDKAKKQFVTQYISTYFNISSLGGRQKPSDLRKQMFNSDRRMKNCFLISMTAFWSQLMVLDLILELTKGEKSWEPARIWLRLL